MKLRVAPQKERGPKRAVDLSKVKRPSYGKSLEQFREGDIYLHPRGMTVTAGICQLFATTFHDSNPLFVNHEYARTLGHPTCPASPQFIFNVVLSLGVQNDSEKAIANLGYYDAFFFRPVYPGDTLRSLTKVLERQDRDDKPGIVKIRTLGVNQRDEPVLQYDRKIMVARAGGKTVDVKTLEPTAKPTVALGFPDSAQWAMELPDPKKGAPRNLTGARTWFDDFTEGEVIVHPQGRSVTDEHFAWAFRLGNTHPLHFDRLYTKSLSGPMSGEPIVYGGLVFAWLEGLASRDTTENSLACLGFTEGYHTQPVFSGDTLTAVSRVLDVHPIKKQPETTATELRKSFSGEAVAEGPGALDAGVVVFQLIGLKNVSAADALEKHGGALFAKENDKDKAARIKEKVFEIERRYLIRTRG